MLLVPSLFGPVSFKTVIDDMGKEVTKFVWSYFKSHSKTAGGTEKCKVIYWGENNPSYL